MCLSIVPQATATVFDVTIFLIIVVVLVVTVVLVIVAILFYRDTYGVFGSSESKLYVKQFTWHLVFRILFSIKTLF